MIFSSGPLKKWHFQKGLCRHMIFLVLSGKMVFSSQKQDLFFIGQKAKDGLSQEIYGNMMRRPANKNRKPDT